MVKCFSSGSVSCVASPKSAIFCNEEVVYFKFKHRYNVCNSMPWKVWPHFVGAPSQLVL